MKTEQAWFHIYDSEESLVVICDFSILARWGVKFWKVDGDAPSVGYFMTRSGKQYAWERVLA